MLSITSWTKIMNNTKTATLSPEEVKSATSKPPIIIEKDESKDEGAE